MLKQRSFHPVEKIKNTDSNVIWKWLCLGAAAVIGFAANVFDTRHKDKIYLSKMDDEISRRADKLLNNSTEE